MLSKGTYIIDRKDGSSQNDPSQVQPASSSARNVLSRSSSLADIPELSVAQDVTGINILASEPGEASSIVSACFPMRSPKLDLPPSLPYSFTLVTPSLAAVLFPRLYLVRRSAPASRCHQRLSF